MPCPPPPSTSNRYYSAFHYYGRRKADGFGSPRQFHERTLQDIQRWNDCKSRFSELECIRRYNPQQLIKGMYSEFVQAWLGVFPKDQVLFLRTEDYKAAPREHLAAVLKFLGMRDLTQDEWQRITGAKRANAQSSMYPRMLPETRQLLEDFYAPYNKRLAALLQDDRYLWRDRTIPAE